MPKMHLKQPRFTHSACGYFNKNKEKIQKFKRVRNPRYIYQNKINKACFQLAIAYEDFKNLPRKTINDG